jgi:hypothetical protein
LNRLLCGTVKGAAMQPFSATCIPISLADMKTAYAPWQHDIYSFVARR